MEQWVLLRKSGDFYKIGEQFQIPPRLACLIRNREIVGEEQIERYLHGTIADLYDGMLLKDMDKAIEILQEKRKEEKNIRVIGDYDIDGVCATYILLEGLERLGMKVDSDIPDRVQDGYGLNKSLICQALEDGIDTIITCDNGIAAAEEIAYAKQEGMTVIVTDHHQVPYIEKEGEKIQKLPPADAVIDPHQSGCEYPFSALCGAAVAYKLVEALFEAAGRDAEDADDLMEAVAMATVGDVMDLVDENRIFVKQGLEMLTCTKNIGLRALKRCTQLDEKKINAYHIGFVLGPCINAGGRMDTAKLALELLRAKEEAEAERLAVILSNLNEERKKQTSEAVEEGRILVETTDYGKEKVLVLYLKQCKESIAGIVAGRIRELYHKPTIVLTDGKEGVKGSGRSIDAYSMFEELTKCKELLLKFGGHKLAAGLSLKEENIEPLRQMLNANCTLSEEDLVEKVTIDMQMPLSCVTEEFVDSLDLLEPFGKGNVKPVFAERNVTILGIKRIGKENNMLKLVLRGEEGTIIDALYFSDAEVLLNTLEEKYGYENVERGFCNRGEQMKLTITYYPQINEYMNRKIPQIIITHFK